MAETPLDQGLVYLAGLFALSGVVGVGAARFLAKGAGIVGEVFPLWVAVWLLISSLICTWDASFVLLRPQGSLDWPLYAPYQQYVQVDKLYGNLESSFVWSQSVMNIVEIGFNLYALVLRASGNQRKGAAVALFVSACTFSKTLLYHIMEVSCNFCNTKQNDVRTLVALYLIPNGIWILVPGICCYILGTRLIARGSKAD